MSSFAPRGESATPPDAVDAALARVREHAFHPIRDGFTFDRSLDEHGVADLNDGDWRVRLFSPCAISCATVVTRTRG